MLFNSNAFYVFLPVVFAIYWMMPQKYRWGVLLVSSYYFYMSWNVKYVVLILLTTVVSYGTALLMERAQDRRKRKLCLAGALVICLGVLFFFKYFNFLSASVAAALQSLAIPVHEVALNLMLPVGISFYTFQTLSYVIDVYRGKEKVCHHFGKYAAFISFFPQLVAGPIERTGNLLPQIEREHDFDADKAIYGSKMIAWGFFKKIAVADAISEYVDVVYNGVSEFTGFPLVLATLFFTIQIYCDFSGYSDIALGVAKLFDIDLMTNFKSPYFSASIREFWSRWHISLSTWFRDYVYIPLGGSRRGKGRTRWNLLVTFLCSGLWHGANWTYVIWGLIHGLGQIAERAWNSLFPPKKGERSWWRVFITFFFVSFAWIFFRANSLADAGYVVTHLLDGITNPLTYVISGYRAYYSAGMVQGSRFLTLLLCVFCMLVLVLHDWLDLKESIWSRLGRLRKPVRYALYFLLLFLVLSSRQIGEYEFVYFQF